jgi:hypothetical protein
LANPEHRLHSSARAELESVFPRLIGSSWKIKSPFERGYNCHAWGVCESRVRWEPSPDDYWPPGLRTGNVAVDYSLDNFIRAYSHVGFRVCANGQFIFGFQKIAIYSRHLGGIEFPQHTSRQTLLGRGWLSKMGYSEDIQHRSTQDLEGAVYGQVVLYMSRSWMRALRDSSSVWIRTTLEHWIYRWEHPKGI